MISRIKEGKFVLVAEIGVNYYDIAEKLNISPMDAAKLMILEAKNAGIHAVKFQSYKAETLASKNSPAYWDRSEEPAESQYVLFKKFDSFGEKEYQELSGFCMKVGIEFMSTAFDTTSADYLKEMVNVYKISSSDLNNLPFVAYQAKKNKAIILSTGASDLDEIKRTVNLIRRYNNQEIVLMHCVLEYPTPCEHVNLSKIKSLQDEFPDLYIGYSDHTKPEKNYDVLKAAYLMGAKVIEKHFTIDKTIKGNDHYHAMDGNDAREILKAVDKMEMLSGSGELKYLESEKLSRLYARRSLVAAENIKEGETVTEEKLTYKRPGTGIAPDKLELILGKKAKRQIEIDSILQWEDFEM